MIILSYLCSMSKNKKILTADEEFQLLKSYKEDGDLKCFDKLVNGNLQNVKKLAYEFFRKNNALPMDELISIGNEVLVKTVINFDYLKGFRLYGYLKKAVTNAFSRGINQNRLVPLPENKYNLYGKIYMGQIIPDDKEQLEYEMFGNITTVSISHISDNEDEEYAPFVIPDDTICEEVRIDELKGEVYYIIDLLNERDAFIITSFFGINCTQLSLSEIAKQIGTSQSNVSNLKKGIISRLNKFYKK